MMGFGSSGIKSKQRVQDGPDGLSMTPAHARYKTCGPATDEPSSVTVPAYQWVTRAGTAWYQQGCLRK